MRVRVAHRRSRLRIALGSSLLCLGILLAAGAVPATAGQPGFRAQGSVGQVYVTDLGPGAEVSLRNASGATVATDRANSRGGVLFRNLRPGRGYRVRHSESGRQSRSLTVLSRRPAPPSRSIYNQRIPSDGYGYLTTRDGTKLAINVHPPRDATNALPGGVPVPSVPPGTPSPTLIEYSGYGYANPDGPDSGIATIANLMGFTVVDVNMRGTGCSGGAYDFFEPLQSIDGYDVIETVARQPWVAHNKVGMMGISYGGISQLFTAQLNPPSLAAISPLSVIDQTQTTLYPGGVLNTGFAVAWARERVHEAKPASPRGGQPWAFARIRQGDRTCKANQALHGEAVDLMAKIRANDHYRPRVADPLSPKTFVHKIKAPTFMACQWTDEQTGGHCPTLAKRFTGTSRKWFTFTNGTHVDSLAPETFNRWFDFLNIYVARQSPSPYTATVRAAAPVIYQEAMGVPGVTLPPDPIQSMPYPAARAAYERLKPVRVLFDNGAGGARPGEPYAAFERSWARFPIPGTTARSWYLSSRGRLTRRPPARPGANAFAWDAHAVPLTNFRGDTGAAVRGLWTANPAYRWRQHPRGTALSYLTRPLRSDTTVVGAGAVHAWVRSSTPNVDLQATVTEVRPDGRERFVQSGWVRASARKLDRRKSTPLEPVLSLRESDVAPMPPNRFVRVTVPLYYQGHAYRARSRIRVTISAPNGDQPIWSFGETDPRARAQVSIAHSRSMPSRLVLPVVAGVDVPAGQPPCRGLRGEPCRNYQRLVNRPAAG